MPADSNRHVVPSPDGGWDVVSPGSNRVESHHETKAKAEAAAKREVETAGGGDVRLHDRQGTIRDSDTMPGGNDPPGKRDTKR
jgi:hypothetical protein